MLFYINIYKIYFQLFIVILYQHTCICVDNHGDQQCILCQNRSDGRVLHSHKSNSESALQHYALRQNHIQNVLLCMHMFN